MSVYFENLLNKEFKRKLSVFLQHSLSFAFTWLKDITVVEFLALTKSLLDLFLVGETKKQVVITERKIYISIYLRLIFNFFFFSLMNWIFAGYSGSKNPIQTSKKIHFIKLEISS